MPGKAIERRKRKNSKLEGWFFHELPLAAKKEKKTMVDKSVIERMELILQRIKRNNPNFLEHLKIKFNNINSESDLRRFQKSLIFDYLNLNEKKDISFELNVCDSLLCGIVGVFIYTYKTNKNVAATLMTSFLIDIKGVSNSASAHKLFDLQDKAPLVFDSIGSQDVRAFFNQSLDFVKSYSEFLGLIFSYWIICLKTILEEEVNSKKIIQSGLAVKVSQLKRLVKKDIIIPFNPIEKVLAFIDVELRNAIAHNSIYINEDKEIIYYNGSHKNNSFKEISFEEYFYKVSTGLYLHVAYKAAISTIFLLKDGVEYNELPRLYLSFITLTDSFADNRIERSKFILKSNYSRKKLIYLMEQKLPIKNRVDENYDELIVFLSKEELYDFDYLVQIIEENLDQVLTWDKYIAKGLYANYNKERGFSVFEKYFAKIGKLKRLENKYFFNHCELLKEIVVRSKIEK